MQSLHPTRRSLLRAGAVLPACLAPAFGREVSKDESERQAQAAWRRAQLVGQPLFLIVVPEDPMGRPTAVGFWSGVMTQLPSEALVTLGACEVHAGTLATTAAALGRELEYDETGVLALLFEPVTGEVGVLEHDKKLRPPTPAGPGSPGPPLGFSTWAKRWSKELGELVGDDWNATQRRYGNAWSAPLPDDIDVPLRELIHSRRAFIRQRAFEPSNDRDKKMWLKLLGAQARARLVEGGPSGARWVEEPVERPAPGPIMGCAGGPCGTGHFPRRGRRLIEFYTQR